MWLLARTHLGYVLLHGTRAINNTGFPYSMVEWHSATLLLPFDVVNGMYKECLIFHTQCAK